MKNYEYPDNPYSFGSTAYMQKKLKDQKKEERVEEEKRDG